MRNLAVFVALSLLLHLVIVYGVRMEMPRRAADSLPLVAQLRPAAPAPVAVVSPPPPPPRQAPAAASRSPRSAAAPARPAASIVPDFPAPHGEPSPPAVPAEMPAGRPPPPKPVIAEGPAAAPTPVDPTVAAAPPAPPRRLPRKGEITYLLYLGTDKFSVGQTLQSWEIHDDGYRLTSVSETTGLISLFRRERRAYESIGKLTAQGLRPESFANQRVRSGRPEDARASFDWSAMTVTLGKLREQKSVALPADAQDLVSFMYQLGLLPLAPGRIELPITNGIKLERYQLDIGAEEMLQTPFGTLRALPVRQVRRPGQESIELWLATEYRLLPVKIRFFDRDGEPSGEQLVSDIRVSED